MDDFTRRKFLSGVAGLTTLASVVPLEAFDFSGPLHNAERHAGPKHFEAMFQPAMEVVHPGESPFRDGVSLNGSWQIQMMPLPLGFREGYDAAPRLPVPLTRQWERQSIRIPSPWNVNSFADHNGEGGDFRCFPSYPKEWEKEGMAWMRRSFAAASAWEGKQIFLKFDAVAGDCVVMVNGKDVGQHFDIFLPFTCDITQALRFDAENEILVGVRKPSLFDKRAGYGRRPYQGGSFWGQHIAGIWQDVTLLALPSVRVHDVYVVADIAGNTLEAHVTLQNDTEQTVSVELAGEVVRFVAQAASTEGDSSFRSAAVDSQPVLRIDAVQTTVPAKGTAIAVLRQRVDRQLELWEPHRPTLYALLVGVKSGRHEIDTKYTRFGWRQFSIRGTEFLLNESPLTLRGDSWHFMGVPQMTRRYARAWFSMLQRMGLNAVRLHAQPYPSFYLDIADEMGMLVLDESAMWASDAGPKLDDLEFWKDSERHLRDLVMRDRNHPSVFGWSVANEMLPIVRSVLRNPPGMLDELVRHYGSWAEICRTLDPSRPWISADGDEDGQGKLPVYIVHYGGPDAMDRAVATGKVWGVGEAGEAYYATPAQVAQTNGDRAYESFEGRMEGVAISSHAALMQQREHGATYRSVFNVVWYGIQPLPLGMRSVAAPPTMDDGIFFGRFVEGHMGTQPERLGPYCTTFNPGYDGALPPYETWPLYEAIAAASQEPPAPTRWSAPPSQEMQTTPPSPEASTRVAVLGGENSVLAEQLRRMGLPLDRLTGQGTVQLLVVDGARPPSTRDARRSVVAVLHAGGCVLVWGVAKDTLPALNRLLAQQIAVTQRSASSLLLQKKSPLLAGMTAASLYFAEDSPPVITTLGLVSDEGKQGNVLLRDCDTDWLRWNKQPEYAKIAMVLRSEREAKPSGTVLMQCGTAKGRLLVTTLPADTSSVRMEAVGRTLLGNLGVPLVAGLDSGKPLLRNGQLIRALVCGFFPQAAAAATRQALAEPEAGARIAPGTALEGVAWKTVEQTTGVFDIAKLRLAGSPQNAVMYLSFWMSSPRSLDDLLLEPNPPRVDLRAEYQGDAIGLLLNGLEVPLAGSDGKGKRCVGAEALKLRRGWNHLLLAMGHTGGDWRLAAQIQSSDALFLSQMDSALTYGS